MEEMDEEMDEEMEEKIKKYKCRERQRVRSSLSLSTP